MIDPERKYYLRLFEHFLFTIELCLGKLGVGKISVLTFFRGEFALCVRFPGKSGGNKR